MARLQILELPEGSGDERPPFVLVVDQYEPPPYPGEPEQSPLDGVAEKIGARAILAFEDTIDIPANDTSAYLQQVAEEAGATIGKITAAYSAEVLADQRTGIAHDMDRLAKRRDELASALGMEQGSGWDDIRNTAAEFRSELIRSENARERLRQDRDEARSWARHGYEIGQRHCGWSDHGVAPAWLTEGWGPAEFGTCEHLKHAADLEEAEAIRKRVASEQKAALTDALGVDRLRDWDDIRNAAAGLRKDRDSRAATTEKIRQIHTKTLQDDRHEDSGVCNADAEDWPCRTIQALNTKPGTNA